MASIWFRIGICGVLVIHGPPELSMTHDRIGSKSGNDFSSRGFFLRILDPKPGPYTGLPYVRFVRWVVLTACVSLLI